MIVYWLDGRELCWDQHLVAETVDALGWESIEGPPHGSEPCVLVVPARYHTPAEINALTAPLGNVLVILTSDEESLFDHTELDAPNRWVMTPGDGVLRADKFIGEGYPPGTREAFTAATTDRPVDVFFAGQVTHPRREACMAAASRLPVAKVLLGTEGFLQGMARPDYLATMAQSKIVLCPSGPATPDSFRLYEALEAGCVPIADATCPACSTPDYWSLVCPGAPFPVIDDWADLPKYVDAELADWPRNSNRLFAWWQQYKRNLRCSMQDVFGYDTEGVTVLIPTSPIPSHPSTAVIEETLRSVQERLPGAEVIVMADGVRPEQAHRQSDYDLYLQSLLRFCNNHGIVPLVAGDHLHQANLTRVALDMVRTDLVLFVEHDTPLVGDVDWTGCGNVVRSGQANVIRFHHEANILEPHRHLMLDEETVDVDGVPLRRTVQWSQRPHLASTGFYRSMLDGYFGRESRTMIEDVMHGVVETTWLRHHLAGWAQFRVWMYTPAGDMKRSTHLDGREGDEKFPMQYAYDGAIPFGAPHP